MAGSDDAAIGAARSGLQASQQGGRLQAPCWTIYPSSRFDARAYLRRIAHLARTGHETSAQQLEFATALKG
jgi:hypothetical protein